MLSTDRVHEVLKQSRRINKVKARQKNLLEGNLRKLFCLSPKHIVVFCNVGGASDWIIKDIDQLNLNVRTRLPAALGAFRLLWDLFVWPAHTLWVCMWVCVCVCVLVYSLYFEYFIQFVSLSEMYVCMQNDGHCSEFVSLMSLKHLWCHWNISDVMFSLTEE